jgi:serine/threonine protein kinase
VYDFDIEGDNLYYMVMEFIEGPTLRAELETRRLSSRPFTLTEIAHQVSGLAAAVDYAHSRNMIHRDLKPANIMFTGEGQVVLTGFGTAYLMGAAASTTGGRGRRRDCSPVCPGRRRPDRTGQKPRQASIHQRRMPEVFTHPGLPGRAVAPVLSLSKEASR